MHLAKTTRANSQTYAAIAKQNSTQRTAGSGPRHFCIFFAFTILIPNIYYRTGIGDRWAEDSDKLHNWGYLR